MDVKHDQGDHLKCPREDEENIWTSQGEVQSMWVDVYWMRDYERDYTNR